MKILSIITSIVAIVLIGSFLFAESKKEQQLRKDNANQEVTVKNDNNKSNQDVNSEVNENPLLYPPIENAKDRVTKKPFGKFVTPQNSPVSPERFYGYHDAADFEIFPGEEDKDIEIRAVCSGEILPKRMVSGYGGVAVQACELGNDPITVIYGHLKLSSINKKVGESWEKGEVIGILGKGYSNETDGERKHLHLGIHKGRAINILGYVSSREKLNDWIDPCLYVCGR